jgi:festuclavine dehydrogenase
MLSEVLGRTITHVKLSPEEFTSFLVSSSIPQYLAEYLSILDVGISEGSENRLNDAVEEVTGKPPGNFRDFAVENRQRWL